MAPLAQATGGKRPLAQAAGEWMTLVQATDGQVPLVWVKCSRGLSPMWCLLHDLQATGTNHKKPEGGVA